MTCRLPFETETDLAMEISMVGSGSAGSGSGSWSGSRSCSDSGSGASSSVLVSSVLGLLPGGFRMESDGETPVLLLSAGDMGENFC
jgi:hypothetical protein